MTDNLNNTPLGAIYEILCDQGFAGLAAAIVTLLNEVMKIERTEYLQAGLYERTGERRGYANGYKPKTVQSRVGELALSVPQTRDGGFYPSSLEKGLRSERALKLALAEMYIQGVSTRKVAKITEELCGIEVNSMQVSRATKALDETLSAWRERPLGEYRYVYLDARYEKVREGGQVVSCAVLLAIGVRPDGKREVLGCSVSLSEQEVHWRTFLRSLVSRGLHGVQLIISDAHEGLKQAKQAVFPTVPWQRCQVHLQRNAAQYVPKMDMRKDVAADIRAVFYAPNRAEADRLLTLMLEKYEKSAPRLVSWAETNLAEGLTVLDFPRSHQRRLQTTNVLERLNREIKRRTRVATLFPNADSCLRLVSAIAMETSDEWEVGHRYLTFDK